ncbi:MAG: hypothetical protein ACXVCS_13120 [Bdellovibrionota bacterium]
MLAALLLLLVPPAPSWAAAYQPPHVECLAPDPVLLFRPKPNCAGHAENPDGSFVSYQQNEMGLWDRDYPPQAAPKKVRVLFLGGSFWISHRPGLGVWDFFRDSLKDIPIETVNGSVNGFSLVQSYLMLPALLERYYPDAVVVLGMTVGNGLSTFYHHSVARKEETSGLATAIGPVPSFWPLPASWEPRLWRNDSAFQWLIYSTVAHEIFLLTKIALTGGPRPAEIYGQYLKALADLGARHHAPVFIIREGEFDQLPSPVVKYKAESIAGKIWPGQIITAAEANGIYERLAAEKVPIIPLDGDDQFASHFIRSDIHLNAEGMKAYGEVLARKLHDPLGKIWRAKFHSP